MKRSGLPRSSKPMERSAPLKRTGWLRSRPKRSVPDPVRQAVRVRSQGVCERCRCCEASHMHHRVTRSRGGPHHAVNLAHLCAGPGSCDCHSLVHRTNEEPWLIRGRFLHGVYEGPYEPYRSIWGDRRSA